MYRLLLLLIPTSSLLAEIQRRKTAAQREANAIASILFGPSPPGPAFEAIQATAKERARLDAAFDGTINALIAHHKKLGEDPVVSSLEDPEDNVFDDPHYASPPRPADAPPPGGIGWGTNFTPESPPEEPKQSREDLIAEVDRLRAEAEAEEEVFACAECNRTINEGFHYCPQCADKLKCCPRCGCADDPSMSSCFWCAYGKAIREQKAVLDERCPKCGGDTDTGGECVSCGFDTRPGLEASNCVKCGRLCEAETMFCDTCDKERKDSILLQADPAGDEVKVIKESDEPL